MAQASVDHWHADVVLGDGETVHLRPITPADAEALAEFHTRQSRESMYRRFFSPKAQLTDAELEHFTHVDMINRAAIVVERQDELLAWASYERWPGRDDADSAFMVDDALHGKGIATLMLEHLAAIARSNGIQRFTAEVLADNRPMLAVFARAGWPMERHFESGVIDLSFEIDETRAFIDSVERREQRADSQAMARLLLPRAIAVVGATDRPGSVGAALWANVTRRATGTVYAVNPHRPEIGGLPTFPTLAAIDDAQISLAVIAVPAKDVPAAIEDCIAARVRGAVVITDLDGCGIDVNQLVARARRNGVRIVGPASMGMASSRPDVGLGASLIPVKLEPGAIAVSMQSGALAASFLRQAETLGMRLSWFVSLGDRSDVSANDLLQFWDDDETTRVIALYTETLGNPRKFARISRRVSRRRPIVAVRTGAASIGPTGGALYRHAGLIEVPSVQALIDTTRVLVDQPVPRGPRIAVLTNARSPGTLAGAALRTAGLEAVEPPVPLSWRSTLADYPDAVRAALAADDVDGVLVIHAPALPTAGPPGDDLEAACLAATKPVVAVVLGGGDGTLVPRGRVPAFAFPEPAAGVLGRMYAYGQWAAKEVAADVVLEGIEPGAAEAVIGAALARGATVLDPTEIVALLEAYGLACPPTRLVEWREAVEAADEVGYPVAIKATHRAIGRSVRAGVALDLVDADDVSAAAREMHAALGDSAGQLVIQRMLPPSLDLRIRCTLDPQVGPLVDVDLGSQQPDLLAAEHSTLAPLSPASAAALVTTSAAGSALADAGLPTAAVIDAVLRAAQIVADHDTITLLDINPLMVSEDGVWAADAVVHVAAGSVEAPLRRID
jgi:acyl-CoA synthetase (NDP forming)/RimJ/RimL family protein N-acetyltransferase